MKYIKELIRQTNDCNCGLACLAMFSGLSIEAVSTHTGRTCLEPGYGPWLNLAMHAEEMSYWLFHLGFSTFHYLPSQAFENASPEYACVRAEGKLFVPDYGEIEDWIYTGKAAIVGTVSKGHAASERQYGHWLCVDEEIFDPLGEYTDTDFPIVEAILISGRCRRGRATNKSAT